MKIICLMENTMGNELCRCEHGLSLYVEMDNNTFLADTGAGGLFIDNAEKLKANLTKIEAVFLSHGHYDHGGGILDFHKINPGAKIIMQRSALGDYWHKSNEVEKYIGLDPGIREIKNLVLLDGDYSYYEKSFDSNLNEMENNGCYFEKEKNNKEKIEIFHLSIGKQEELKCWPEGNLVLKEKKENQYIQDRFVHEQYLVLEERGKTVLISGCAHNGILNILNEYNKRYNSYPDVIISGFHMRKKNGYTEHDFEIIKETARELKKLGILCYTGHCTGEEPYHLMKEIMGGRLQYLHCGDRIEIES